MFMIWNKITNFKAPLQLLIFVPRVGTLGGCISLSKNHHYDVTLYCIYFFIIVFILIVNSKFPYFFNAFFQRNLIHALHSTSSYTQINQKTFLTKRWMNFSQSHAWSNSYISNNFDEDSKITIMI